MTCIAPSASVPPETVMVCNGCHRERPAGDFRLRSSKGGLRYRQCRSCHNQAERLRRSRARRKITGKEMLGILAQLRAETDNARVVTLCDQMTRRFGGVNGFVRAWEACLARDLQKGGNAAFRHLAAVIRLAQFCEQTKPSPQSMTEEELELAIGALAGSGLGS